MVSKVETVFGNDLAESIRQSLSRSSIFKNEQTLDPNFIPSYLPCRQEELLRLSHFFKPLVDKQDFNAVQLALTGPPGIGKTVLSKLFCEQLVAVLREFDVDLMYAYYSCYSFRTKSAILRDLLSQRFLLTSRGYSDYELLSLLHLRLRKENKHLVIVLDEADILGMDQILRLIHSGDSYTFGDARISLILISRPAEFQRTFKTPLSGYLTDQIEVKQYTRTDFIEILNYRADLAFQPTAIPEGIIQQVADLAVQRQNVRYGLALLHHAGRMADQKQQDHLTAEMIEAAQQDKKAEVEGDRLKELHLHELLTALGITARLKHNGITTTTLNEAYVYYCNVCKKYFIRPKAKPTFRRQLHVLTQQGLIQKVNLPLGRNRRGRRGQITLINTPAALLKLHIQEILTRSLNVNDAEG